MGALNTDYSYISVHSQYSYVQSYHQFIIISVRMFAVAI